jgi:hypothetical protein
MNLVWTSLYDCFLFIRDILLRTGIKVSVLNEASALLWLKYLRCLYNAFKTTLRHLLIPLIFAWMVTNLLYMSWCFIFKCIVDGTAHNDASVVLPKIQLYTDRHGMTKNLIEIVLLEALVFPSWKVVGKAMTPTGCVGDLLNAVRAPPMYCVICSGFSFGLWNNSSCIMSQELPSSIKIRKTPQLAMIANIKISSSWLMYHPLARSLQSRRLASSPILELSTLLYGQVHKIILFVA